MAWGAGVLDLCNGVVSGKTLQIFSPSLPVEYVTTFSGRTDAPEVRFDQTNRQTDPTTVTVAAHARRGLITLRYKLEKCRAFWGEPEQAI